MINRQPPSCNQCMIPTYLLFRKFAFPLTEISHAASCFSMNSTRLAPVELWMSLLFQNKIVRKPHLLANRNDDIYQ